MKMSSTILLRSEDQVLRVFQSRDETKAFYNKISNLYDLLAERSEEPIRNAGLEMLDVQPGEQVLEIGFGTGHCLAALTRGAGSNGRVYGIDLADEMVKVAQKNLDKDSIADRVELTCGDAAKLPYPSDCMDAIFMSFTLELFDTPEIPEVLAECRRVLRSGGRLVVVGLSKEGEGGVVMHVFEWTHKHFPNFLDCRPIFVRRALEDAGFHIKASKLTKMWVPVEIVLGLKCFNAFDKS